MAELLVIDILRSVRYLDTVVQRGSKKPTAHKKRRRVKTKAPC
jgi:hypothetical protein